MPEQEPQEDLQGLGELPPLEDGDLGDKLHPDPGLSEGLPKVPRKDEPPEDHPRFRQVYKKMKDYEREIDPLKKKINEQDEVINTFKRDFGEFQKTAQQKQVVEEGQKVSQEISGLQEKIKTLKASRLEAKKTGDVDREAMIDDQIDGLKDQIYERKLATERGKITKDVEEKTSQGSMNTDVAQFIANTKWFNPKSKKFDPMMFGAAKELDAFLQNHPDWVEEPTGVRLAEVKKRIEERFSYREDGKQEQKHDIPTVEGLGKVSPPGRQGNIQLTDEQRRVAHRFHPELPPQEAEKRYSDSLKFLESRGR
jgi:vacuolar-type H+-ATPase subunit I/STV1